MGAFVDVYGHLLEGDERAAPEAISGAPGKIHAGGSRVAPTEVEGTT
ncbi:hypothetical protein ABGB17_15235 [Sphaerisporangium sp. B11E5]